ncbi:hypothetical protein RZS08_47090, partial [Arthrospira platensis SPKY1]|nr:hypothetical protein [Arthrospira platensis SPKY1]
MHRHLHHREIGRRGRQAPACRPQRPDPAMGRRPAQALAQQAAQGLHALGRETADADARQRIGAADHLRQRLDHGIILGFDIDMQARMGGQQLVQPWHPR